MILAAVEIEVARQQWEDGQRDLQRALTDRAASDGLRRQVELVTAELSRRIGQIFTLDELAAMYDGAERWALQVLCEALPEGATPQVAIVTDAAFHAFSRRATDYTP